MAANIDRISDAESLAVAVAQKLIFLGFAFGNSFNASLPTENSPLLKRSHHWDALSFTKRHGALDCSSSLSSGGTYFTFIYRYTQSA
jgi:hypothetical protein